MGKDLLEQILAETYTQTEALQRLRVLRELIFLQLFGEGEKKTIDAPITPPVQQTGWMASFDRQIFKTFTKDNVYKIFNEIEAEIKKIRPLVVFVPFELPEIGITAIGQYLRKNFGKNFLFETKIDPAIIAGTALVWNGIYKDYSVRQKIIENRKQILEMMKGYLKK